MKYEQGHIRLDRDDNMNIKSINGIDYLFAELDDNCKGGKGGNSSVFRLLSPDPEEPLENEMVVKISNVPNGSYGRSGRRVLRFNREIEALYSAKTSTAAPHIVDIIDDGNLELEGKHFRCYLMPKSDRDLATWLATEEFTLNARLELCEGILDAVHALHKIDIYHRDLKPDNVFLFSTHWKIGDLGLISKRDEDSDLDKKDRKIGPWGFLSPEAINYYHALAFSPRYSNIRIIDTKSDLFQLGLLFWFILQGDVPAGHVSTKDLRLNSKRMSHAIAGSIIKPMLKFNKQKRPPYDDLKRRFKSVCK